MFIALCRVLASAGSIVGTCVLSACCGPALGADVEGVRVLRPDSRESWVVEVVCGAELAARVADGLIYVTVGGLARSAESVRRAGEDVEVLFSARLRLGEAAVGVRGESLEHCVVGEVSAIFEGDIDAALRAGRSDLQAVLVDTDSWSGRALFCGDDVTESGWLPVEFP